uniref:G1/S-specific cyclin-D2 n=1 Tax=Lepeophtheirus salmonis TaxID=72036 RepID=C1BUC5_LEPSM|nr:G1/S-specific cyclin-D2 [Lepeophtheirus salmonis]
MSSNDLLCSESLDYLGASPLPLKSETVSSSFDVPLTVRAEPDPAFLKKRILHNLLSNEKDFLPIHKDFLKEVQRGCITDEHRRILGEWMRDVVFEVGSGPDTFCLAMNLLDRFLSLVPLGSPSQLQLLGTVTLLVASKLRDSESIPGRSLIIYTDHSITSKEIKDWEWLLLQKLGWEINGVTPFDYLDHLLPRLSFPSSLDMKEFRKFAETILVLVANEYAFTSLPPSRIAASAILIAYRRLSENPSINSLLRSLQSLLLLSNTNDPESSVRDISSVLPQYLVDKVPLPTSLGQEEVEEKEDQAKKSVSPSSGYSPEPDLMCSELFDENIHDSSKCSSTSSEDSTDYYRSNSPLSAVDIFTEFDRGVFQAVLDSDEKPGASSSSSDSPLSILVS